MVCLLCMTLYYALSLCAGIFALYAWLLWSHKAKLSSTKLDRETDVTLRPTRFLWASYTPARCYWELIECLRRLVLTGAIVFIAAGTSAQAAIACVLAVLSACIALYCKPHSNHWDGKIYAIGALVVFLSMFLSLAIKTNVSNETHASQRSFAVVMLILNVVMIIAAAVQVLFTASGTFVAAVANDDSTLDSTNLEEASAEQRQQMIVSGNGMLPSNTARTDDTCTTGMSR
jgi:hypothetical protein